MVTEVCTKFESKAGRDVSISVGARWTKRIDLKPKPFGRDQSKNDCGGDETSDA